MANIAAGGVTRILCRERQRARPPTANFERGVGGNVQLLSPNRPLPRMRRCDFPRSRSSLLVCTRRKSALSKRGAAVRAFAFLASLPKPLSRPLTRPSASTSLICLCLVMVRGEQGMSCTDTFCFTPIVKAATVRYRGRHASSRALLGAPSPLPSFLWAAASCMLWPRKFCGVEGGWQRSLSSCSSTRTFELQAFWPSTARTLQARRRAQGGRIAIGGPSWSPR